MAIAYDYENQAWTVDGIYVPCGHPCRCLPAQTCYGMIHAGEPAPLCDVPVWMPEENRPEPCGFVLPCVEHRAK